MTQIDTNSNADKDETAASTIEYVAAQKAANTPTTMFKAVGALAGALAGLPISQMFQSDKSFISIFPTIDYLEVIFTEAPGMLEHGSLTPVILTVAALSVAGFYIGDLLARKIA